MKTAFEIAEHIAHRLEEEGLPYAIGGALALTAVALPRDTKDVDLSVFVDPSDLPRVLDALERAGVMVDRADAARTVATIGLFTSRFGRTLVDVFVGTHPHFITMQHRRISVRSPSGESLWFLSAEDLAIFKLFYARTKDVSDLERMFAALPDLDAAYIRQWLEKMVVGGDRRLAILGDLEARFPRGK